VTVQGFFLKITLEKNKNVYYDYEYDHGHSLLAVRAAAVRRQPDDHEMSSIVESLRWLIQTSLLVTVVRTDSFEQTKRWNKHAR